MLRALVPEGVNLHRHHAKPEHPLSDAPENLDHIHFLHRATQRNPEIHRVYFRKEARLEIAATNPAEASTPKNQNLCGSAPLR